MKFCKLDETLLPLLVTPFAGVWIEITDVEPLTQALAVTPFAGVWIEIGCSIRTTTDGNRHSLRGSVD